MLARWGIRIASSLIGIAVGIVLSIAILDGFSSSTDGARRGDDRLLDRFPHRQLLRTARVDPPTVVSLAGLLALASTIVSLIIVNLIVSDISIDGVSATSAQPS